MLNDQQQVLVADEFVAGLEFTKYPGGGLEFGEGTIDCLKRECIEEMNQPVEITKHYYTTDYYQPSAFNSDDQLISIYYLMQPQGKLQFETKEKPFDFSPKENGALSFRWISLKDLSEDAFRFPIDQLVTKKIIEDFS